MRKFASLSPSLRGMSVNTDRGSAIRLWHTPSGNCLKSAIASYLNEGAERGTAHPSQKGFLKLSYGTALERSFDLVIS